MSIDKVQSAVVGAIATTLDGVKTSYENVAFDPPSNEKWARVSFLPNSPSVSTLGDQGEDEVDGIAQIDLSYPLNTGTSEPRTDFENIRGMFPAGKRLTSSGQQVIIRNCWRSTGRNVDGWYRISVSMSWYALIPR